MKQATNFSEEMLPQINAVLKFVLENPHSDFYRQKYAGLDLYPIQSYADFQRIPPLTKDEFLVVPLKERTFVPEEEIARYSFSSGTTNSRKPTILPHTSATFQKSADYDLLRDEDQLKKMGITNILLALPPYSSPFLRLLQWPRNHTRVIPADIQNLSLSAGIAKEIGIDCIATTPTILYLLIDSLQKIDFAMHRIKFISIMAEFCSVQKMEYFKRAFPNAQVRFGFGSSEMGMLGYQCEYLSGKPGIFHPLPHILIETLDETGFILPEGEVGELVHTHLHSAAFPLVRYRSRDYGSIQEELCACGNNHLLSIGGRAEHDFLKFSGIILQVQAIENALDSVREYLSGRFQMHVFEKESAGRLLSQLVLHLELKKEFEKNSADPHFQVMLRETISEKLFLSSKSNLKTLVQQDIFLPLEIQFNTLQKEGKTRHIISHLT